MKHIRNYENHRTNKIDDLAINEQTLNIDNDIMVVANIRIPRSVVNGYAKKVKDLTGKDLKDIFGESAIAEEIVKYISSNFINVDSIPVNALIGGPDPQAQTQIASEEVPVGQAQAQVQAPVQGGDVQTQVQAPVQAQTPIQDENNFEDIQAQAQTQVQVQAQTQEEEEKEDESDELPI